MPIETIKKTVFLRITSNLCLFNLSDWMTFVPNYKIEDSHGTEEPELLYQILHRQAVLTCTYNIIDNSSLWPITAGRNSVA